MSFTKAIPSKSLVIRINLVFLAVFFVIYAFLLLRLSSSYYHESAASLVRCSLRQCHHKVENGIKMKAVLEETDQANHSKPKRKIIKRENPTFLNEFSKGLKTAMVNMDDEDTSQWEIHGQTVPVPFEQVSELFEWKDLIPEWIDEEEEIDGPLCPEIPIPDFKDYL